MNRRSLRILAVFAAAAWLACGHVGTSRAQSRLFPEAGNEGFSIVGAFDNSFAAEPAKVTAKFAPPTTDRPALLMITARLQPGWHTYAITQPRGRSGGPQPTRIVLTPSPKYRLLAPFRAHPEHKSHIDTEAWVGLELREHEGEVTWFAPVELARGADPGTLEIRGLVDMQVCKEQCVPLRPEFAARLGTVIDGLPLRDLTSSPPFTIPRTEPTTTGTFQAADSEVKITGHLEPAAVRPGETARLVLSAEASPNWHVYAHADRDDGAGSKETLIAFETTWGIPAGKPTTDAPITTDSSVPNFPTMHYHKGPVTWTIDLAVPKNAEPGKYPIVGAIGYQACEFRADGFGTCEFPLAARFETVIHVAGEGSAERNRVPLTFTSASYANAAKLADQWTRFQQGLPASPLPRLGATAQANPAAPDSTALSAQPYDLSRIDIQEQSGTLLHYLALAFVGGLILNLMPCVLPVIGLKVMSFVEQAGRSRAHAFALNAWYAAGIVSVFLLLGGLAVTIGLSWGGQFGSTAFNVVMAAIVFAMALSLLGVWEVPIPAFFGSGRVQDAAAKEGPLGAYLKGAVTTVLATPCTAPFMATAIAWAVAQPASTTLAVFAILGLGMASPYLLVGVFPELLRFLPRPGAWMETFKQISGFILLATVVFILSFIEPAAIVPTILLFVGIGLACWLIARTPLTAERRERLGAWATSGAVVLMFAVGSFGWLYRDVMLPRYGGLRSAVKEGWDPFSLAKLQNVAVEAGRTVLVDFSADWCFNCKVLERTVLESVPVRDAIQEAGAAQLYADYTDYPPEIDDTIKALKSNGVPVVAIFPGDRPYEPIVFRGGYTTAGLIEALKSAKPRTATTTLLPDPAAEITAAAR
jgi:thiol:disulfide interchange protein/DsbC/DsbD-like thiol-disulfide interchange protein